jgi:uncharacterized protein (DUF427 family)
MKAKWNGAVLAESEETVVVEGNHYFPPDSINRDYLREGDYHTTCPWKGRASYYDVVVDSDVNENAAWTYPQPMQAARQITDYIAFWKGVAVEQ